MDAHDGARKRFARERLAFRPNLTIAVDLSPVSASRLATEMVEQLRETAPDAAVVREESAGDTGVIHELALTTEDGLALPGAGVHPDGVQVMQPGHEEIQEARRILRQARRDLRQAAQAAIAAKAGDDEDPTLPGRDEGPGRDARGDGPVRDARGDGPARSARDDRWHRTTGWARTRRTAAAANGMACTWR